MDEQKFQIYLGEKKEESNEIDEANESTLLKSKIIIVFDFTLKEFNFNMTLFDIKKIINLKYNIQEYEYQLYLNEIPIRHLDDEILIISLLYKYNTNKIIIKAFKNIFDIKNEFNNYETLLTNNISLKDNEINLLNIEYENIIKDLQNI